jgi:hypothetical protein
MLFDVESCLTSNVVRCRMLFDVECCSMSNVVRCRKLFDVESCSTSKLYDVECCLMSKVVRRLMLFDVECSSSTCYNTYHYSYMTCITCITGRYYYISNGGKVLFMYLLPQLLYPRTLLTTSLWYI